MSDVVVSVVMPVRNGARWVATAIDSILLQSMRDFELIVVDNSSTDETPHILAGYAARDRRVVAIRETVLGAAAARNAGLAIARGDWIASMDSDDISAHERLERQLRLAATNSNLALIGSGFDEIDETDNVVRTCRYPRGDRALRQRLVRLKGFFPASSAFFRRSLAQELGGYRLTVGYAEDWDMWLRLAAVGQLGCAPTALVGIRRHAEQISQFEGGRPQMVHALGATVASWLRTRHQSDPTADASTSLNFLAWVERRMGEDGYFEQRRVWQEARAKALQGTNRASSLLRFGADIFSSGYGPKLLAQKLMGNDLPRRLADEWARGRP